MMTQLRIAWQVGILLLSVLVGTPQAFVCGDASGDGNISVTDGVQVLRAAAALSSPCNGSRCDVDGNGTITVTDGVNVLRAAAGIRVGFRCAPVQFLGIFRETEEQFAPMADTNPTVDLALPDTGATIVLGRDRTVPIDVNGDGDLDGGFFGFENNLNDVANIYAVYAKVHIPGAALNDPAITYDFLFTTPLPPASTSYIQTAFMPADVVAFLEANQNLLPLTPFNMTVVLRIPDANSELSYTIRVETP